MVFSRILLQKLQTRYAFFATVRICAGIFISLLQKFGYTFTK